MSDELKDVMVDWASGVTAPPGLIDAVHARDRRGRRRRRAVVSVLTALVLVAGVGVTWLVAPWRSDADRLTPANEGDTPSAEASPSDGASPSAGPASAGAAPPAPVGFGWLPGQYTSMDANAVGTDAWLYRSDASSPPSTLLMWVTATEPPKTVGKGHFGTAKVNGVTGTTYSVPAHDVGAPPYGNIPPDADGATEEITFQRKPGQWIRLNIHLAGGTMDMGVTGADVVRIAEELTDEPTAVPELVRIDGFDGLTVVSSSYSQHFGADIELAFESDPAPETVWRDGNLLLKSQPPIEIHLSSEMASDIYLGNLPNDPVVRTVQARNGTITIRKSRLQGKRVAKVELLKDKQVAVVIVPASMSEDDMIRLASAITPGKDYKPTDR